MDLKASITEQRNVRSINYILLGLQSKTLILAVHIFSMSWKC